MLGSDPQQQQLSEAVYNTGLQWGIQIVASGTVSDFRHHPPTPAPLRPAAATRSKKKKKRKAPSTPTTRKAPSIKRQRRSPATAAGGAVEQKITNMVLLLQEMPLPVESGWTCVHAVRGGTGSKAGYTDARFTAPSKNHCSLKTLLAMLHRVIAYHQRPADFTYHEVWQLAPWYLRLYDIRHEFLDGGRYKIGGCYSEKTMGELPPSSLQIAREVCARVRCIPEPVDLPIALVDAIEMQELLPYLDANVPVCGATVVSEQPHASYDLDSLEAELCAILEPRMLRRSGVGAMEQFERAQAVKCMDFVAQTIADPVVFIDSLLSNSQDELVREMSACGSFHTVHGTPNAAATWEIVLATHVGGGARHVCFALAPVFVYFPHADGSGYVRCFSGWELRRPGSPDQGGSLAGPHYVTGVVNANAGFDSANITSTVHNYIRSLDLERATAIKREGGKKAEEHRYEVLLHLSLPLFDPATQRVYHEEKWFPLSCGLDAQDPCTFRICAAAESLPLDNRAAPPTDVKKKDESVVPQLQLEQLFDVPVEELVDYCARERLPVRMEGDLEDEKNVRMPLVNAILAKHGLSALFS